MIDVREVLELHRAMVVRWHQLPVDNQYTGVLSLVCEQHGYNFLLWHEEDIARSKDVTDARIAQVKRAIDKYNQQRNDAIERVDDWITADLASRQVTAPDGAPMNTETPGSVIDRLSILALRIYHMEEQTERTDATPEHIESCRRKVAICRLQQHELSQALEQLLADQYAGRKRHRTYRQLKMYNDPTLNPYLYQAVNRT